MIQGKHIIEPTNTIQSSDRTEYTFTIDSDMFLSEVFDVIPSNSIIHKGRCGIGGTRLELLSDRNSIIIVPTNAIINDKCFDDYGVLRDNFYVVRGKSKRFDYKGLREFISSASVKKKIFCTPESFGKIIKCGFPVDRLNKEWFVLFDESHTTITDDYRKGILNAYKYVFKFENVSFISATPYSFSSPRLSGFNRYTIKFDKPIGAVNVCISNNIKGAIQTILKHPSRFDGRVHIFLNEVAEIANSVRLAKLTDCSIFCAIDSDNIEKLDELRGHVKQKPELSNFSKFNFYTSKYFEGWDLHDEGATIIIISDLSKPTLITGISNKCVQAVGRNRMSSNRIIHITNERGINEFKDAIIIHKEVKHRADSILNCYNQHIEDCLKDETAPDNNFVKILDDYGDLDHATKIATLNDFKVDRIVNREFCNQEYNSVNFIRRAWERCCYDVQIDYITVNELPNNIGTLRKSRQIEVVTDFLLKLHANTADKTEHFLTHERYLPFEFEYIRKYYEVLGPERLEALGYDPKLIRKEYIEANNEMQMPYLKADYYAIVGDSAYYKDEIINILKDLYVKYGILNPQKVKDVVKHPKVTDLKTLYTKFTNTKKDGIIAYKITTF